MRKILLGLIFVSLTLAIFLTPQIAFSQAVKPSISLSQTEGTAGSTITVSGTGFAVNSKINVEVDGAIQASATTDPSGSFNGVQITISSGAAQGQPIGIVVRDAVGDVDGDGFIVTSTTSSTSSSTYVPEISLSQTEGPPGTTVTVSGTGFAVNSKINVEVDGAIQASATTDPSGSFNGVQITISSGAAQGQPIGIVVSDAIGLTASDGFIVTSATTGTPPAITSGSSTASVQPSISLSQYTGPAGTIITVFGKGFSPNSDTGIFIDGNKLTSIATDSTGSFSGVQITIPSSSFSGERDIILANDAAGNTASAAFTVTGTTTSSPTQHRSIPSWIKNTAGWWSDGQTSDKEFASAIGYLTSNGIIVTDLTGTAGSTVIVPSNIHIPQWIKNDANWWSKGKLDDSTFLQGIQYMLNSNIITFTNNSEQNTQTSNSNTGLSGQSITSVSLSQNTGPAGTTVTVSGTGFKPNSRIVVAVEGTKQPSTMADPSGSFSGVQITIPSNASPGYSVDIYAGDDAPRTNYAYAFFKVTKGSEISLSQTDGPFGTTVTVSGTGFTPYSDVDIYIDGDKQTTTTADSTGSFSGVQVTISMKFIQAQGVLIEGDDAFGHRSYATFSVTGQGTSGTPPTPSFGNSPAPSSGNSPTTTTISSSPNPSTYGQSVTFTATVSPSTATGSVIFKDGSTTLVIIPLSGGTTTYITPALSVGSHTITATYLGDTNDASSSSTISQIVNQATATPPSSSNSSPPTTSTSVSLSQYAGPAGTTITVSGTGFTPNSNAGIFIDGGRQASATTDSTGSFGAIQVTIPSSASPGQAIGILVEDVAGNFAEPAFVIIGKTAGAPSVIYSPKISLSQTEGPAGTTITLSGTGFAVNSKIGVMIYATVLTSTTTTDSSGSFSGVQITIPSGAAKNQSIGIVAEDAIGNSAENAYTVTK